jgi:hypothetical protein
VVMGIHDKRRSAPLLFSERGVAPGKSGKEMQEQAERWIESKSLRDFSVGLYLLFIEGGLQAESF